MVPTSTMDISSTRRLRVLVVDDDVLVGRALARVLQPFEVTPVRSAAEALALLRAGADFSAIVCDMLMPAMNGIQLYQEIARSFPGLERGIVFLTGHRTSPLVAEFLAHVSNVCMDKPFDDVALRAAVAGASRR
jgi:CheY-like chemotaxis protein